MAERFDEEIEDIIDVFLAGEPHVFTDFRQIETILYMHEIHHLCELAVGTGRYVIAEPRRGGTLTLAVNPDMNRLYKHRGVVPH